ncbi:hypothetical protein RZS08_38565, partial [Arthrospira platensis SPKY1]|nr:hypothetical protein [Arthrospira platensis SPKY1]
RQQPAQAGDHDALAGVGDGSLNHEGLGIHLDSVDRSRSTARSEDRAFFNNGRFFKRRSTLVLPGLASTRLADRNEQDRLLPGKIEQPFHRRVGESADDGRAEAEGDRLQAEVLGGMAGFDMHIAFGPFSIPPARALKHRRDDHGGRRIGHP